jgi:hypothetical protein
MRVDRVFRDVKPRRNGLFGRLIKDALNDLELAVGKRQRHANFGPSPLAKHPCAAAALTLKWSRSLHCAIRLPCLPRSSKNRESASLPHPDD